MREKVLVLMSTYNGEQYIEQLLTSLLNQKMKCDLIVRDDGSTDNTVQIIKKYQKKMTIYILEGDNKGSRLSFYELIKYVYINRLEYEYYAFCDQDDVWNQNKIFEAGKKICKYDDYPTLYVGSWTYVDENLEFISEHVTDGSYSFNEILVKNHIIGCTMFFNNNLFKILCEGLKNIDLNVLPFHDHWTYIVCLAVGGKVISDNNSYLLYRQHANNVVGKRSIVKRIKNLSIFYYKKRSKYIEQLQYCYEPYVSKKNKKYIQYLLSYQNKNLFKVIHVALFNNLKTQTVLEKIVIDLSFLLKRF